MIIRRFVRPLQYLDPLFAQDAVFGHGGFEEAFDLGGESDHIIAIFSQVTLLRKDAKIPL